MNPLDLRRITAALVHYWRDIKGADHVYPQASLERDILQMVDVDERTFRSVLHQLWRRGIVERQEASPAAILWRVSPDIPDPLWRRYCPALEARLVDPLALAGPAGSFHLMGRPARLAAAQSTRWPIPTHRLHAGAWAWAWSWQCAVAEARFADPKDALPVAVEAAQKGLVELVWSRCQQATVSTINARVLQVFRETPTFTLLATAFRADRFWRQHPRRLFAAGQDALHAVELGAGELFFRRSRVQESWRKWMLELGSRVRRNVTATSPPTKLGVSPGSPRYWRRLERFIRTLDPGTRATLRQSERAWAWPFSEGDLARTGVSVGLPTRINVVSSQVSPNLQFMGEG